MKRTLSVIIAALILSASVMTSCADKSADGGPAPSDVPGSDTKIESITKEEITTDDEADVIGKEVYSGNGIRVEYIGLNLDMSNPPAEFLITNKTQDKVVADINVYAANGYQILSTSEECVIPAGDKGTIKSSLGSFRISEEYMTDSEIYQISAELNVVSGDKAIVDHEIISVITDEEKIHEVPENELYNKDGFRFFTYYSDFDEKTLLCFENCTSDAVGVALNSVEVNGAAADLGEHRRVCDYPTVMGNTKVVLDWYGLDNSGFEEFEHNFFAKQIGSDTTVSFVICNQPVYPETQITDENTILITDSIGLR